MSQSEASKIIVNARFLTQPLTGVQRFASELCLYLKEILPEIIFVSPQNILHKDLAKQLGVVSFGNFSSHFWEQLELPLYLKKRQNAILVNLCNTAPLFYKRNIVCIHDIAFLVNPKWFSATFVSLYKFLIPKIAHRSLKVITVSNFSKQAIVKYIGIHESKIEVVYNSIADIFNNQLVKGSSEFEDYLLAVSSIDPRKNLIFLVKAFKKLNIKGLKLIIVGAESKVFADTSLKEEIRDCSSIVFTGYVSDPELAVLYQNALMFVYPSLYEGFGIPPLEAMASGCPTIVSNASSLPEICGEASLYVNPDEINDLVNKIELLYADKQLRMEMRDRGYQQIKCYSWEKSALQLASIIRQY